MHQCIVLKIFYTLKPSTHIKLNFKNFKKIIKKLLQHVSVPLDYHQGARHSYPKVTTDRLLVRYNGAAVPSLTAQNTHRQGNTDITKHLTQACCRRTTV